MRIQPHRSWLTPIRQAVYPITSRMFARHNRPYLIVGIVLAVPLAATIVLAIVLDISSTANVHKASGAQVAQNPSTGVDGQSNASLTSPNPDAPATGPATPAPSAAHYPSDILSLTSWKLTLPINSDDSRNPDEIQQPELNSFINSSYFYVNATGNGVVFQAPITGATTSGSNFPRSELREMTSDGKDEASWSTGTGVSTMTVTEAVTHLPVARPEVVAAQIHGPNAYLILIRLEGSNLFVEKNGKNIGTLNANYALGTVYALKITANNGTVTVDYNGQQKASFADSSSGNYFKAGCYTQSNTKQDEPEGAYGQVVLYGLSVSHS